MWGMKQLEGRSLGNKQRYALLVFTVCVLLVPGLAGGAAQNGKPTIRVSDSILGVRIGSSLEEAHAALEGLGTFGGRATRDGGRKEAWTFQKTDFSSLAYQTNGKGRIKWVMGFVRPGKQISFSKLGDLKQTMKNSPSEVVWTVETIPVSYRVGAIGMAGRARRVYLIALP
jgi:hypothetical protein